MTPFHSLSLVTAFVFLCFSSTVLFADVMEDKFKQLNSWYRKGLITEAEFERSKKDLLKNYTQLQASEAKTSSRYQAVVEEENLMAVIPFFGKVYADGDRDTMAKFAVKNIRSYMQRKGYHSLCLHASGLSL